MKTRDQPEDFDPPQADMEAIRRVVDITAAATKANYFGPLIAAVSFVSSRHIYIGLLVNLA